MKMKRTITLILTLLLVLSFAKAVTATAPVLLFSDLTSGPKTGWEGSSFKGAAVSVWGTGFGSARGSSYITVNGAKLTADSDYAEWATTGTANGVVRDMQRTTFWIPNTATDGLGQITITVDGKTSNSLPFTVRSGNIYFISVNTGSNTNNGKYATVQAQGGSNGPWKDMFMTDPARNAVIKPGDTIYVRAGIYTTYGEDDLIIYWRGIGGTPGNPIATVGYPNEWPQIGDANSGFAGRAAIANYHISDPGADYLEWHKLLFKHGRGAFSFSPNLNRGENAGPHHIRIVGNRFEESQKLAWSGIIYADGAHDFAILGNYFYKNGYNKFKHELYINPASSGQTGGEAYNIEVAWNEVRDGYNDPGAGADAGGPAFGFGHDSPTGTYHEVYVHDNLFINYIDGAILWGEDVGNNVYVYNNQFINLAKNRRPIFYASVWNKGPIYFWNNLIYNSGGSAGMVTALWKSNLQLKNNIFYSVGDSYTGYVDAASGATVYSDNDNWYGNANLPSGNGVTVINPLNVNPLFVNPSAGDFHLQSNSPAIDAGSSAVSSIVAKDYDSNPRPMGSGYDIGAYEYSGTYTPPPPPTPSTCTYTYSTWNTCQADSTQTRTLVSSSPSGCTGTPILSQSCIYTPPAASSDPLLLYPSAKAGPNQGWENSATKGAAITIWAKHIGASRGSSTLTVAGVTLDKDTDFAEWGAYTNPKTAKDFTRITFWLNSNMPVGNTDGIYITINGKKSNTLPFKIDNTGEIYFLALDGNDNYDGKQAAYKGGTQGPWKNFGKATSKMTPGDFLYMRAGDWTQIHNSGSGNYEYIGYFEGQNYYEPTIDGIDSLRITLASYPGEVAVFKNVAVADYSDYWTFANLKWSGGNQPFTMGSQWSHCAENSDHSIGLDIIGNEFVGSMDHSIQAFGDNFRIVANVFDINPVDSTSYVLYLSAGNTRLVKDNEISGGSMYNIHAYDEDRSSCTELNRNLENWIIEDNWMDASNKGQGYLGPIILGAGAPSIMRNITVRNNIFFSDGSASMMGIRLFNGYSITSDIQIYGNTFYGFPIGIYIDYATSKAFDNILIKNNIFSNIAGKDINNDVTVPFTLNIERNLYDSTPAMTSATDTNSVVGNPQFVNPSGFDFHLKDTSPAIDAGLSLAGINEDYDHNPRPQGSAYDIGAYEYVSSTTTYPKGDVNQDTNVNSIDIQLAVNIILGLENNQQFVKNADLNNDGDVNAIDLQLIVNIVLGV